MTIARCAQSESSSPSHELKVLMKAKILIVDDDPDIATMLEDRLQASDYGTVIAQDGVQALELVEQEAPHLMLLDLDMPRLTRP
jgi:CheY-like chemotaxis protein